MCKINILAVEEVLTLGGEFDRQMVMVSDDAGAEEVVKIHGEKLEEIAAKHGFSDLDELLEMCEISSQGDDDDDWLV